MTTTATNKTKRIYLLWHTRAETKDGSSGGVLAVTTNKQLAQAWEQLSPHSADKPNNTHLVMARTIRGHLEIVKGKTVGSSVDLTIDNPLDLIALVEIEMWRP